MPKPHNLSLAKQTAIIVYSNIVVFFDFLIYLYLADTLSVVFFPNIEDPLIAKLQIFGVFAAGYFARPFGGFIMGRFGDTKGRKPAFVLTSFFIVATSLIAACLPTYDQIGIMAPILFVIVRLLQGMGFASQSVLGWVYISEHAPRRKLGVYISLVTMSFLVGTLFAEFMFEYIFATFSPEIMADRAWRLVFFVSTLFGCVTLFLSRYLQETPAFLENNPIDSDAPKPTVSEVNNNRFHAIFLSTLFSFQVASLFVVTALILPELVQLRLAVNEVLVNWAHIVGIIFFIIGTVFYGLLADKGHIGRTLMIGSIFLIVQVLIFYYILQNISSDYILITYALLGFASGIIVLPPIIMLQLFPTAQRFTFVAVIHNTIYAIVGGLLPIALNYATSFVALSPALYLVFVGIVSFLTGQYVYQAPKFSYLRDNTDKTGAALITK